MVESGGPRTVAGCLARTGHHTECLAHCGLIAGLLTATIERGAQLACAERVEVSAIDQVAGIEGAWVAQMTAKGAGGEVSRAVVVGHVDR